MRFLAVVAGIGICALGASSAADPAGKARADKLFEDGRKYLATKEYALACTAFEQSQESDPAIGTQLNIALCYEEWGKTASAYRAYLEAVQLAKLKSDKRAKGAQDKADELAPKVPHVQLEVPDDADVGAVFLLDGKELDRARLADDLLVDPGTHVVEVRISGQPPKKTVIDLKAGERRRVAVEIPKPVAKPAEVRTSPRNKRRLYGGIGLTVGGAITLGVAGFVALAARQDYNDAVAGCPALLCASRADYDATQSARSRATLMTFVGGGGLVLSGIGVYFMLTSAGHRTTEHAVTIAPTLTPTGAGLAIGGTL